MMASVMVSAVLDSENGVTQAVPDFGTFRLRITAVGNDPASTGFAFGLDAIDLMNDAYQK